MNLAQKPDETPFEKFQENLEEVFREGWTNNADTLSILYTGTPA